MNKITAMKSLSIMIKIIIVDERYTFIGFMSKKKHLIANFIDL